MLESPESPNGIQGFLFDVNVPRRIQRKRTTGWRMPKPEQRLVFVGVAPGALCEQIKDPARNGGKDMAALRAHLDDPRRERFVASQPVCVQLPTDQRHADV